MVAFAAGRTLLRAAQRPSTIAVAATLATYYYSFSHKERHLQSQTYSHRFHLLDLNSRRYSAIPDLNGVDFHSVVLTEGSATALGADGQIYDIREAGKLVTVRAIEKDAVSLAANERWFCVGLRDRIKLYSQVEEGHSEQVVTVMMPATERLKQVEAGRETVTVLSDSGICYELGPDNTFQRLKSLPQIAEIASGESHTLFRSKDGVAYGIGSNSFGQLGAKFEERFFQQPTLIKIPGGNVTHIAAGGDTSYFVSNDSDLYSCGMGQYGQLGNGSWTHIQTSPIRMKTLSNIHQYNEDSNRVEQKKVDYITAAAHHAAMTYRNDGRYSQFGQSVYAWGKSILGGGKRTHIATPMTPLPLAGEEDGLDRMQMRTEQGRRQRIVCGGDKAAVYWEAQKNH